MQCLFLQRERAGGRGRRSREGKGVSVQVAPPLPFWKNYIQVDSVGGEEGGLSQSCHRGHLPRPPHHTHFPKQVLKHLWCRKRP